MRKIQLNFTLSILTLAIDNDSITILCAFIHKSQEKNNAFGINYVTFQLIQNTALKLSVYLSEIVYL